MLALKLRNFNWISECDNCLDSHFESVHKLVVMHLFVLLIDGRLVGNSLNGDPRSHLCKKSTHETRVCPTKLIVKFSDL